MQEVQLLAHRFYGSQSFSQTYSFLVRSSHQSRSSELSRVWVTLSFLTQPLSIRTDSLSTNLANCNCAYNVQLQHRQWVRPSSRAGRNHRLQHLHLLWQTTQWVALANLGGSMRRCDVRRMSVAEPGHCEFWAQRIVRQIPELQNSPTVPGMPRAQTYYLRKLGFCSFKLDLRPTRPSVWCTSAQYKAIIIREATSNFDATRLQLERFQTVVFDIEIFTKLDWMYHFARCLCGATTGRNYSRYTVDFGPVQGVVIFIWLSLMKAKRSLEARR